MRSSSKRNGHKHTYPIKRYRVCYRTIGASPSPEAEPQIWTLLCNSMCSSRSQTERVFSCTTGYACSKLEAIQ